VTCEMKQIQETFLYELAAWRYFWRVYKQTQGTWFIWSMDSNNVIDPREKKRKWNI